MRTNRKLRITTSIREKSTQWRFKCDSSDAPIRLRGFIFRPWLLHWRERFFRKEGTTSTETHPGLEVLSCYIPLTACGELIYSVDNLAEKSPKQTVVYLLLRLTQSLSVRAKANVNTTLLSHILKVNKPSNVLKFKEAGNNADLIACCFACKDTQVIWRRQKQLSTTTTSILHHLMWFWHFVHFTSSTRNM